jgi:hypothetical protein
MARKKPTDSSKPPAMDLRTRYCDVELTPEMKRFDMFLIDTGWNAPVSKAVRAQLRYLWEYQKQDSLYELSHEQSLEVLKRDPALIGHDPTIIVYDLYGSAQTNCGNYHGFRLNLGLLRNAEQAVARLQQFIRFLAAHRTAQRLDLEVRRDLHREGMEGMVKLLREASVEMLVG